MLVSILQSSLDVPSHIIPMICKYCRTYGNMKGLHPLIPMFSALDSCPRLPTENNLEISPQTSLLLPFNDICKEDQQGKFKFSKFLQAQKAYHFFSNVGQFNNKQHCGSLNFPQKIKNAILNDNLIFKPFFLHFLLSSEPNELELTMESSDSYGKPTGNNSLNRLLT
ncbi:hypothetical protein RO3G_05039 [Rhizopus delemar RA 99-880]|uniref:Uncharacterized protein n=1 Tax=Rhizopus delemar (strain RA 99-880 / ATCC MYA-4621 / FGSC 9543 / NRRL 43880) TaxID=246409 RepID=I1BVV4_RHIO9|nr:hypothetical protein RO3G_05039 [Rhizopus delemar RA 99-880]|eukprot:EIE80334.1 hypothetical protein RO3G_05039 [Rhizopus delemar RA 99-880]